MGGGGGGDSHERAIHREINSKEACEEKRMKCVHARGELDRKVYNLQSCGFTRGV